LGQDAEIKQHLKIQIQKISIRKNLPDEDLEKDLVAEWEEEWVKELVAAETEWAIKTDSGEICK
jgi:hypothetical protein